MDKQQLLATLETLHSELTGSKKIDATQLDDETRKQLQTITADIQQLLGQSETVSRAEVEPVTASIQDMILQFETEHPSLTAALNRIASGLSNLGI